MKKMSCENEKKSNTLYCKCLKKQIKMFEHPSAAPRLIDDIMKKYFCEKAAQGSSCSLFSIPNKSVYSMDKRLHYWSKILEDRKKLACRIRKITGKRLSHVLYNQLEDHRNVQNVKRIMDVAERLDPTKLSMRKENNLKSTDLFETLPKSEKLQIADIEIVGMPKVSLAEQWMKQNDNAFLSSDFLHRKLRSHTKSFLKIIEHYPETDRLEIVGKRIHKHVQSIERGSDYELSVMSSESFMESLDFPDYCLQINDCTYKIDDKPIQQIKFQLEFKCQPFESQALVLLRIRNNGRKPLWCVWRRIKPIGFAYMASMEPAFQFNQKSFVLTYDQTKTVEITFSPNRRMKCEEEWQLITEPSFFEENKNINMKLSGECYIPREFLRPIIIDILEFVSSRVIRGTDCQRPILTECELFEKRNPGFKCNNEDLRKFKEMFRQFKNKSHPHTWDLKLQTLKLLIEGRRNFSKRQQGLNDLRRIIREMRLRSSFCDLNIKTKIARSVIISFFDKWESKAIQIVNSVASTEIDVLVIRMPLIIDKLEQCRTSEDKRKIIKHQALYIQMYCYFCDLIDEIVSFIDNCLLLEQNF